MPLVASDPDSCPSRVALKGGASSGQVSLQPAAVGIINGSAASSQVLSDWTSFGEFATCRIRVGLAAATTPPQAICEAPPWPEPTPAGPPPAARALAVEPVYQGREHRWLRQRHDCLEGKRVTDPVAPGNLYPRNRCSIRALFGVGREPGVSRREPIVRRVSDDTDHEKRPDPETGPALSASRRCPLMLRLECPSTVGRTAR